MKNYNLDRLKFALLVAYVLPYMGYLIPFSAQGKSKGQKSWTRCEILSSKQIRVPFIDTFVSHQ